MRTYGEYQPHVNVVVFGDVGVGKTQLLNANSKQFSTDYVPTKFLDIVAKSYKIMGKEYELYFFDFSGKDEFEINRMKSPGRAKYAALIVFDITNKDSFDHLPKWEAELKKYMDIECKDTIYVGNKCDTPVLDIPHHEFFDYVESKDGLMAFLTSAESELNVLPLFRALATTAVFNCLMGHRDIRDSDRYQEVITSIFDSVEGPKYLNKKIKQVQQDIPLLRIQ